MARDEIGLKVLGAHGQIDARAMHQSLGALLALLKHSDRSAHPPRWTLTQLELGSIAFAVRPAGVVEAETFETLDIIGTGLDELRTADEIPDDWDDEMVRLLLEISSITSLDGVDGVDLSVGGRDPVRLDQEVTAHAERSVSERRVSIGSVRGHVDRYVNRGNRREFGLVDRVTNQSIRVTFPVHLRERVADAVERDVVAWGRLFRNAEGRKLRLAMEDFEFVEPSDPPETVDAMVGALGADWTGGAESTEFVRRQRRGT